MYRWRGAAAATAWVIAANFGGSRAYFAGLGFATPGDAGWTTSETSAAVFLDHEAAVCTARSLARDTAAANIAVEPARYLLAERDAPMEGIDVAKWEAAARSALEVGDTVCLGPETTLLLCRALRSERAVRVAAEESAERWRETAVAAAEQREEQRARADGAVADSRDLRDR